MFSFTKSIVRRTRLSLEHLEDRLTTSWAGAPPVQVTPSAPVGVMLSNHDTDASGVNVTVGGEVNYYSFTTPTSGPYTFQAWTPNSNMDTFIGVFNASGQRLGYNDNIDFPSNTDSWLQLTLEANQTYYLGVTNYAGMPHGSYYWSI